MASRGSPSGLRGRPTLPSVTMAFSSAWGRRESLLGRSITRRSDWERFLVGRPVVGSLPRWRRMTGSHSYSQRFWRQVSMENGGLLPCTPPNEFSSGRWQVAADPRFRPGCPLGLIWKPSMRSNPRVGVSAVGSNSSPAFSSLPRRISRSEVPSDLPAAGRDSR